MSAASRFSWELIERIISHYDDDLQTLCSFSRTCRELRPHSLCLMVAKVEIYERKQVAAFRDFLVAFPQYRTFVREILTRASTFMPFPLIPMAWSLSTSVIRRVEETSGLPVALGGVRVSVLDAVAEALVLVVVGRGTQRFFFFLSAGLGGGPLGLFR